MKTYRYCDCGKLIQAEPVEENITLTTTTCSECWSKAIKSVLEKVVKK